MTNPTPMFVKSTLPLLLLCAYTLSFCQESEKLNGLLAQAIAMEDSGNFKGALELSKKIFKADPKNVAAANSVAGVYGKLNQFDEEIIWANKAIKLNPAFMLSYINLGNGYMGAGKLPQALANYEYAAQLDPNSPLPTYSLGVVQETKGSYETAKTLYEKSILQDSTFENGYFNLAAMCAALHDFQSAKKNLLKVLELNPRAYDAWEMLTHIKKELGE